ncbi:GlxA family transcriptional regulator [Lutimaribacter marinistellae]|uniref:GlxA family transcriptional regulator n=1 Tax=Lutimaribacter marinistellae TaxID=1820329 RepID=A0ABV7TDC9_9RHOB
MPTYSVPKLRHLSQRVRSPKRIVIVTNAASDSLEYIGLLQVFAEVRFFLRESGYAQAYSVEIVSRGTGQIYACEGLSISTTTSYAELGDTVDTLILQAADDRDECLNDTDFISWIAQMSTRVRRIVSICTGAFILAEAGVLDGRQATTHWAASEDFRSRYPNVRLTDNEIFTKDGHVYTSAGVTAGMDLALALVEEDLGPELARRVAQAMVVFFKRPGDQSQFNALGNPGPETAHLHPIEVHIRENLDGDLRLESLARRFGYSLRSFNRMFPKQFGLPPGQFIEQCRLDHARRLLEETDKPVSCIAAECGYASSEGLYQVFDRRLGIGPRDYRNRFSSSVQSTVLG